MSLQPIRQFYKGVHFRSRLEARWATFFDAIGWDWEYEKEGYKLPVWYLPDFYIPDLDAFIEVKGQDPTDKELEKAFLLCKQSKKRVAIVQSIPNPFKNKYNSETIFYLFKPTDSHWVDLKKRKGYYFFTQCFFCGKIEMDFCECQEKNKFYTRLYDRPKIKNAYYQALNKQFH